jgi:hypothetical protein
MHGVELGKTRSVLLISALISTDNWNQLEFPSSDIMFIQVTGNWGKLTVFNIYNDRNSNKTLSLLTEFHRDNRDKLGSQELENAHLIWLSDFNRHHPHWDDSNDTRLFMDNLEVLRVAELLIEMVASIGLVLVLPSGTPTHYHNVTKKWSRLDQVSITEQSENTLITCDMQTDHRGIKMDPPSHLNQAKPVSGCNGSKLYAKLS